jgi:hypothetical protein
MKFPKQIRKWRIWGRKIQLFRSNSVRRYGFQQVPGGNRPTLNQRILWLGSVFVLVQG